MRIPKVNELIKQELSKILLEEVNFDDGVMVTVMFVETSDTLENATIWVSIFPEKKRGTVFADLNKEVGNIQKILNRRLSLRFVPKITFKIDQSGEYASSLDKIFNEISDK